MDWELLYSGLTAFGTVGAVAISLWFTLHKKQRFLIEEINVYRRINADKTEENYLGITFENLIEAPMEIHSVELKFIQDSVKNYSSTEWKLENEAVASLSQYELKLPLEKGWATGSLSKAEKVNLEIKSSFGNKTVNVPKKEKIKLYNCMEVEKRNL